jgi:hypothetical protein
MNQSPVLIIAVTTVLVAEGHPWASVGDDNIETIAQLTLADLAAYRMALSGKATADAAESTDLPVSVGFKDLWEHSEHFRGRRVVVEGRVSRIFRQGPIGQFPPLAELWVGSSAGDPFCLVVPQSIETSPSAASTGGGKRSEAQVAIPEMGTRIRFTGTFLKMVRYVAGDVARSAPLLVGNQLQVLARETGQLSGQHSARRSLSSAVGPIAPIFYWRAFVTVTIPGAVLGTILAWWQLRPRARTARYRQYLGTNPSSPFDLPLEFDEPNV